MAKDRRFFLDVFERLSIRENYTEALQLQRIDVV